MTSEKQLKHLINIKYMAVYALRPSALPLHYGTVTFWGIKPAALLCMTPNVSSNRFLYRSRLVHRFDQFAQAVCWTASFHACESGARIH